jgi:hypothetical protein
MVTRLRCSVRAYLNVINPSAVLGRTINGHPAGDLTRDDVLDNITLYWLTNTVISSARLYWENKVNLYLSANVSIPAAAQSSEPSHMRTAAAGGDTSPFEWLVRAEIGCLVAKFRDRPLALACCLPTRHWCRA